MEPIHTKIVVRSVGMLAIPIPKYIAETEELAKGMPVDIYQRDNGDLVFIVQKKNTVPFDFRSR